MYYLIDDVEFYAAYKTSNFYGRVSIQVKRINYTRMYLVTLSLSIISRSCGFDMFFSSLRSSTGPDQTTPQTLPFQISVNSRYLSQWCMKL